MGQIRSLTAQALTLDQYRALNLTRPYTDPPIGATTASRRDEGARASDLHTDHSEIPLKVDPKLERSGRGSRNARRGAYKALRAAQRANRAGYHPTNGDDPA